MHFVVAVDGTDCSERALVKAIRFMKDKTTDKLTLVHAVEIGKVCHVILGFLQILIRVIAVSCGYSCSAGGSLDR